MMCTVEFFCPVPSRQFIPPSKDEGKVKIFLWMPWKYMNEWGELLHAFLTVALIVGDWSAS
jgi:hypothetical protein